MRGRRIGGIPGLLLCLLVSKGLFAGRVEGLVELDEAAVVAFQLPVGRIGLQGFLVGQKSIVVLPDGFIGDRQVVQHLAVIGPLLSSPFEAKQGLAVDFQQTIMFGQ